MDSPRGRYDPGGKKPKALSLELPREAQAHAACWRCQPPGTLGADRPGVDETRPGAGRSAGISKWLRLAPALQRHNSASARTPASKKRSNRAGFPSPSPSDRVGDTPADHSIGRQSPTTRGLLRRESGVEPRKKRRLHAGTIYDAATMTVVGRAHGGGAWRLIGYNLLLRLWLLLKRT